MSSSNYLKCIKYLDNILKLKKIMLIVITEGLWNCDKKGEIECEELLWRRQ